MSYIELLRQAIITQHGCKAEHVRTEPVKETFRGQTIWEGDVEIFSVDHPETSLAYAWGTNENGQFTGTTVLGIGPIDSPLKAVQASVVKEAK